MTTAEQCVEKSCIPPFTAFMSADQWLAIDGLLLEKYPDLEIHEMLPDGSRLAVEIMEN